MGDDGTGDNGIGDNGTRDIGTVAPKAPPLKRKQHHRAPHFAVLTLNLVIALGCFLGAGALVLGQNVLDDQRKTADIVNPTNTIRNPLAQPTDSTGAGTDDSTGATTVGGEIVTTTTEPFPVADPEAKNFQITGSDNGGCNHPNSANPIEERDSLGERSDTIMIMRVDPSTSRASVLSFPRDLWVKIAGTNTTNRINSAYSVNDPQKLIDTIFLNFGLAVDHYIQIDFCAFKTLVDSVGGVTVPFQYPARDKNTGLDVPTAGCYTFNGDSALAYVRSRHYQYLDPDTGKFRDDNGYDYGRIARQQDFLRRAVAKVLSQGVFDLDVARGLVEVAKNYVVTDPDLTLGKQLEFAGVLKNLDPDEIRTYQVEGVGKTIRNNAVIEPRLEGDNMKAILAIFRGWAQLATAPEQVFETTTTVDRSTTTVAESTTTAPRSSTTVAQTTTTTTTATTTTTTLPVVTVEDQDTRGIVPPDIKCP